MLLSLLLAKAGMMVMIDKGDLFIGRFFTELWS